MHDLEPPRPHMTPVKQRPRGREEPWGSPAFEITFGIVLPVMCVLIAMGTTDSSFPDPLPSPLHVGAVTFIILTNIALLALRSASGRLRTALLAAGGVALGFGFVYLAAFAPLQPIAAVAVLFAGLGFLLMTPVLCFFATRRFVKRFAGPRTTVQERRLVWTLAVLAAAVLFWEDARIHRVSSHVRAASSKVESVQAEAIAWLRENATRDDLDRLAHRRAVRSGLFAAMYGTAFTGRAHVSPEVYYRITGRLPPPRPRSDWFGGDVGPDERDSDVLLVSSRLDGSIDTVGASAYLEWTFVVQNDSSFVQHGSLNLALPVGGVVSRATLWVDGEPQEAAYAGRALARRAYEQIAVVERRDPLLVEWRGEDQVRLRFYPIPPDGGQMRFLVGMSVPLEICDAHRARLVMPVVEAGATTIAGDLRHTVWVESGFPFEAGGGRWSSDDRGRDLHVIDVAIDDDEFPGLGAIELEIMRPEIMSCLVDDPADHPRAVVQTIERELHATADGVVVAVDTSESMRAHLPGVVAALASLSPGVVRAVVVGDDLPRAFHDPAEGLAMLVSMPVGGGKDGCRVLAEAFKAARAERSRDVVWIHGPQPVDLAEGLGLEQQIERGGRGMRILDIRVGGGINVVADTVRQYCRVDSTSAGAGVARHLVRRVQQLVGQRPRWTVRRRGIDRGESGSLPRAADDVWRLHMADRIDEIAETDLAVAVQTARSYHLVTPVSSAVCLETKEQYRRFNLTQADRELLPEIAVPTVPEPETWALIAACGLIAAVWFLRMRGGA